MLRPRSRDLLAAVLLWALAGCGPSGPPNVFIIVVDTLRADRLGSYGNRRGLTPFLDELADDGTVFRHAHATSSWTNPSVASLLTSRYPSQHRVVTFFSLLPDEELTLAEILRAFGWATAGFSANGALNRAAYGQGFDAWGVHPREPKLAAGRLSGKALRWMERVRQRDPKRPLFVYLQYMEPHAPYAPPRAYQERFVPPLPGGVTVAGASRKLADLAWDEISPAEVAVLQHLYDAEVAALDAELQEFFTTLAGKGLLRNSVIVITADHGEEFREHGSLQHGSSLFNEQIRVPLLVLAPGTRKGRTVSDNVSLVDVAPTVLELARLPLMPRFEGRSLLRLMAKRGSHPDVIAQLPLKGVPGDFARHSAALIRGPAKLLLTRDGEAAERPVAYDLDEDAAERRPDPPELAGEVPELVAELQALQERLARRATQRAETIQLDEQAIQRLRALGYLN